MPYGIRVEGEKARSLVFQRMRKNQWPRDAPRLNSAAAQLRDEGLLRISLGPTGRGFVAVLKEGKGENL